MPQFIKLSNTIINTKYIFQITTYDTHHIIEFIQFRSDYTKQPLNINKNLNVMDYEVIEQWINNGADCFHYKGPIVANVSQCKRRDY